MGRSLGWLCIAAAAALMAGCTSDGEPRQSAANAGAGSGRQCFFTSSVSSFAPVDTRTVNLRVGANQFFRVNLMSPCRDVTWTTGMSLSTRGSSSICTGNALGVTLHTRGPSGRQRCTVSTIVALTPEEVQALSGRQRP